MNFVKAFITKIWNDPVWSKVIAVGVIAIIGALFTLPRSYWNSEFIIKQRQVPTSHNIATKTNLLTNVNKNVNNKISNSLTPVAQNKLEKSRKKTSTNYMSATTLKSSADTCRYEKPVPQREGNDVLMPLIILQAIPGFDETKNVYVATYNNNWLNITNLEIQSDVLEASILKREGNVWRVMGLAGTRFHPVQLKNSNLTTNMFKPDNLSWLRIEDLPRVYGVTWNKFSTEFIDPNPPGPCFLIR